MVKRTKYNPVKESDKRIGHSIFKYIQAVMISLILSQLLTGCESNPAEINLKYDYSVYAYLMIGEAVDKDNPISVKRHLDPYKPFSEQDTGVSDAIVRLFSNEDPGIDEILVHSDNGDYISAAGSSLLIQPNMNYSIEIVISGHIISAQTKTPNATTFENSVMSADSLSLPNLSLDTLKVNPIKVGCPPGEERIVYIETYCLEDYRNARFRYNYTGNEYPKDQEEYESPTGGFPRRLDSVGVFSSRENIDPNKILITDYDSMFFFYGRNRISVYVIDRNYYEYLVKTKGWENGGLTGAYGVFGSGVGQRYYLNIPE